MIDPLTMKLRRIFIGLTVLLAVVVNSPLWANPEGEIRGVIHAADLRQTQVSVLAVDLSSQKVLVSIDADVPMIPASNMKLVTTAAALHVLGPEYNFQTTLRLITPEDWSTVSDRQIQQRGVPVDQGSVLIVHGDGDPGFCDPDLLREADWDVDQLMGVWAKAVRDAGVTQVQSLIIDDRVFDQQFVHPSWPVDQLHQWYAAQVAGINFYDNCLDVYPTPTEPGIAAQTLTFPSGVRVILTNKLVTGKTDSIWLTRQPLTNKVTVGGSVKNRRTSPLQVTLHDPPMVFAQVLVHHLAEAGVTVLRIDRPQPEDRLPEGKTLHRVQTTMTAVLRRCNKDSQNLFAESLLKRLGREFTGTAGGWDNAAAAVRYFLQDKIGPSGAAVTVVDGSGLSRDNRVTARVLVDILDKMYQDPNLGPAYLASLAIPGVDGTLKSRLRKGVYGQVHAKSGYIKKASTLSGYLIAPPRPTAADPAATRIPRVPRVIAFSLLFNDFKPPVHVYKIKQTQDKIVKILDRHLKSVEKPKQTVATP